MTLHVQESTAQRLGNWLVPEKVDKLDRHVSVAERVGTGLLGRPIYAADRMCKAAGFPLPWSDGAGLFADLATCAGRLTQQSYHRR